MDGSMGWLRRPEPTVWPVYLRSMLKFAQVLTLILGRAYLWQLAM